MSLDPLTTVTDDVDDILAIHHNELVDAVNHVMASSAYSNYSTVASMTGNVTLTDASLPVLSYSPTAARDLTLPAVATTNHPFYVFNRSDTYSITVKNASAVVIAVISPLSHVTISSDGSNGWYVVTHGYKERFYKITPTVLTNNLIVAIKHLDGTDPTPSRPLWTKIGNVDRAIVAGLSVTVNAGASTFNAGHAQLATKAIDYFTYFSWKTSASAVVMLVSRIPTASLYSDFNTTSTHERYAAYSAQPAGTDECINIGRFEATNSGTASYNWSVPTTYTTETLKNYPIYDTRVLTWVPAPNNITIGDGTIVGRYQIRDRRFYFVWELTFGSTTSISGDPTCTPPLLPVSAVGTSVIGLVRLVDASPAGAYAALCTTDNSLIYIRSQNASGTYLTQTPPSSTIPFTWATSDAMNVNGEYPIAV